MIQFEKSNPSFESCFDCIHADDSEEMCIIRRCIHAVGQLKECYVPKQPTIEPERKKGKWIGDRLISTNGGTYGVRRCSECEAYYQDVGYGWNYCPNCGADMREEGDQDE